MTSADDCLSDDGESGFAIISMLGVVLILSALALSLVGYGYSVKRSTSAYVSRAQASSIADGALNEEIGNLLEGISDGGRSFVSEAHNAEPRGWVVTTQVVAELEKVDLNVATYANLVALLEFKGVGSQKASHIASAILDWRDVDSLKRIDGAEAEDYRHEESNIVPRNGPIETLEELRFIAGMDQEIFLKIQDEVTVLSRNFLATQQALSTIVSNSPVLMLAPDPTGRAFTIKATVERNSQIVMERKAVIRVVGRRDNPYLVYSWGG